MKTFFGRDDGRTPGSLAPLVRVVAAGGETTGDIIFGNSATFHALPNTIKTESNQAPD